MLSEKVINRFWTNVSIGGFNECWNWKRSRFFNTGYGAFYNGERLTSAHRTSWEITRGNIPEGIFVLHECDNRICCNPLHLFLGTAKDNTRDMIKKGRQRFPVGERIGHSKLTDDIVSQIRKQYRSGKFKYKAFEKAYGVSESVISEAIRGVSWKHVSEPPVIINRNRA